MVIQAFSVGGVYQGQGVGVRVPSDNTVRPFSQTPIEGLIILQAITDINSASIACNTGYMQPVSQTVIQVPAGSKVTAHFHHKSTGYVGPDPADPLDPTNKGPVIAYLWVS